MKCLNKWLEIVIGAFLVAKYELINRGLGGMIF